MKAHLTSWKHRDVPQWFVFNTSAKPKTKARKRASKKDDESEEDDEEDLQDDDDDDKDKPVKGTKEKQVEVATPLKKRRSSRLVK
jgi:hypothetical protein